MSALCALAGMTRQNFYKGRKRRTHLSIDEELVLELVRQERRILPMVGVRKLLVMLEEPLAEAGIRIGRNRLFELLKRNDLLIEPKRRGARTTDSRHRFRVYRNLLKDKPSKGPHEAWVCDLTYIRTESGFVYLSLVMDAFSRKIVGYHVNDSLEAAGCMRSLQMAIRQLPAGAHPIHHSDRGTQYCCEGYVELLEERHLPISMTEENHCYENAKAERLNGILKGEFGLGGTLKGIEEVRRLVTKEVVPLYNTRRLHTALGFRTPEVVHRMGKLEAREAPEALPRTPGFIE